MNDPIAVLLFASLLVLAVLVPLVAALSFVGDDEKDLRELLRSGHREFHAILGDVHAMVTGKHEKVPYKEWVGKLVRLTKHVKITDHGVMRTLPTYTIGRLVGVHKHSGRLADPLTGEVFARSVPLARIELLPGASKQEIIDSGLMRASRPALETAVIELREAVRAMKGSSQAGDERLERLFALLPEHGNPEYDPAYAAKPDDEPVGFP